MLLAGGVVCAALPLPALPLQRADVAAAPAWALHVDCDQLRPSALGQYLLAELEKPEARARLNALWGPLQFNLRQHLHGLTFYSRADAPENGVLLVYGDFQPGQLERAAQTAKGHETTPYKKHQIHQWLDASAAGQRVYGAMHRERVLVLARREPNVARALDVLDRAARSLAQSGQLPQLGARPAGVFLQAASAKLDLPALHPAAALFRLARAARLEVGEASGRLGATLNLETNDEAGAAQILSASQALLALLKLQPDSSGAAKLAEGLRLKQQGAEVVATLAVPTRDAIALMQQGPGRAERKKAGD